MSWMPTSRITPPLWRTSANHGLPGANAPRVAGDDPYLLELQHFLAALDGAAPLLVTPRDALEALRVALAAVESIRTGRPVELASFRETQ
jgi:predicted dehydrogenase